MYDDSRNGGYSSPRESFSPVKVGDEFDTVVEAVGEKGDGVCKKKGFVIFVPGVKQGDQIRVRITKVFKKVGFGELVGPSSSHIEPSEGPNYSDNNQSEQNYERESSPQDLNEDDFSEDFGEEDKE